MKHTLKILIAFVFVIAFVVACGAQEPEIVEVTRVVTESVVEEVEVTRIVEGEVQTETIEVTRIVEVPVEPEERPEPAKIRVISFNQGFVFTDIFGADGLEDTERLKEFEDKENIDVIVEWGDETAIRQKVGSDLAAGTGRYCVMVLGTDGNIQTYGTGGLVEPLNEYFDTVEQDYVNLDDFYPSFVEANSFDGQIYGLPYFSFGPGMIYRTDIFEKYGVEPPTTMDELYEVLETLKQGFEADGVEDMYPLTMRAAPGEEPSLDLLGFVYANAGQPAWFEGGASTPEEIKANKAQPVFTSPEFADGFKDFTELSARYGPPGISTHTWVDMMNLYMQGNAAILMPSAINGYAALTSSGDEELKANTGFAPVPVGDSGEAIQSFWSFSMGMNKDCPDKEEAFKVIAFLTGKESQQGFAEMTGWPTVSVSEVMHSDPIVSRWGEEEVMLNEQAILDSDPYYFPYIPELNEFMDRIGTAASTTVSGEKTADEALQELQDWAVERMEQAGYYE